jgi:hypothetical protein
MKVSLGNELRIGNLIKLPIGDTKFKIGKVYQIDVTDINNSIPTWTCKSIKLTKEWFDICGFKKSGPVSFYKEFGEGVGTITIHLIDNEAILSHYGTVITGVHHLQNLWMDITGEFLEYDWEMLGQAIIQGTIE